jgi:SagB-type dehydrogenase family enzyme
MRLRPDVQLASGPDGDFALLHGNHRGERIGRLTPGQLAAVRQIATGWFTESQLCATIKQHDGSSSNALLRRLIVGGWISIRVELDGRHLVTVRPLGPNTEPPPPPPVAPRLSRFAVLRRGPQDLVLESPLARAAVTVHDRDVMTLLHRLAGPGPAHGPGLPGPVAGELIDLLAWHRFVHEAEEDTRPDLASEQWSPHELMFHSRSRAGYHDEPFGGTLWAAGRFEPLPGRREPAAGTAVALPRPSQQAQSAAEPLLTEVLEARRSIRVQDHQHPITIGQLGEFLYRSARVLRADRDGEHDVSLRPAPAGGALHALEIYPVVTNVAGLPVGLYHYDAYDHLLEPLPPRDFPTSQLVAKAAAAAGGSASPQVLLVIACRFGRVMWKYQGMGYALVLKEVGALFQTFYLVATAMGLAPCALGSGDSQLFARATGLDPLVEGSVGEFMLGSRPPQR